MASSKVMKTAMKKTAMKKVPATTSAKRTSKEQLTKAGQHLIFGDRCLSTSVKGVPCGLPRTAKGLPYCKRCMAAGDPSLLVKQHPKFGKILIAARGLPKGYNVAWWGDVRSKKQMTEAAMEWALSTNTKPMMYIDACPFKGSQLKFTACPGPSEIPTIDFASPKYNKLLDVKASKSCYLFSTLCAIPKSHQVTMMYNLDEKTTDGFFKDMGLVRADVGTAKYPAIRKANKGPAPWAKEYKSPSAMKGKGKA